MKSIVVLFASASSVHMFDAVFDELNAYQKSLQWAKNVSNCNAIYVFADSNVVEPCQTFCKDFEAEQNIKIVQKDSWTVRELLQTLQEKCKESNAQNVVYAWADCPFLNNDLTLEVLKTHLEYSAEYTFADGYPYGFAPEVIDCGTCGIIAELSVKEGLPNLTGFNQVSRDSIFSSMKGDINAFEIETVIAPTDYRMYRLNFHCGSKEGLLACTKLSEIAEKTDNAEALSKKAVSCSKILRTVPGFYNIQIESKYRSDCIYSPYAKALKESKKSFSRMSFEQFKPLVKQIAEFSENAVVSLSLWGEPLYHPELEKFVLEVLQYSGLSVFIETTGDSITENLVSQISELAKKSAPRTNGFDSVIWVVYVDSITKEKYKEIHFTDGFTKAIEAVALLEKYFPQSVYPQFVRMNQNEDQLESFYRFWSDKKSPSNGKLIIQKYNSYCGLLPENKPCDLTPVERYPDWHLRRDMVILCNGDVPLYKESMLDNSIGNVFEESLESIWQKSDHLMEDQINHKYDEISGKSDEYYTFNF